jgi:NAD(P)-dependent dehydrogenase (short-subunit alcohol dehydrogenase family)
MAELTHTQRAAPAPQAATDLTESIVAAVVEVCRHEAGQLTPNARLEEDLGVSPARMGEILARLQQTYPHAPADAAMFARCATFGQFLDCAAAAIAPDPRVNAEREHRGKVAFITGSGRGIGRALASMLARQGAHGVINSFHSRSEGVAAAAAINAAGGSAVHSWGSIAKPDHVERMFAQIDAAFGGVDYFINNASNGLIGPLSEVGPEHWERGYRTNVLGLHLGALQAVPRMQRRGGGRIVAITSPGARDCIDHFACQGSLKAAVEALIRYLADSFGPLGIGAAAISPGPVAGDLLLSKYPDQERLVPHWRALAPGGRLSSEQDVCRGVSYLLSARGRALNGAVVLADVGTTLRM